MSCSCHASTPGALFPEIHTSYCPAFHTNAALARFIGSQPDLVGSPAPKRPRVLARRLKSSPDGRAQYALGVRIGYWPCVRGPYLQVALGPWCLSLWFGGPGAAP